MAAGHLSPEPRSAQAVSPVDLQSAIDNLGKLDYDIRTSASRVVRRSLASLAVPALVDAAAKHADGYVQYRALVLLTGFSDSRTTASMQLAMTSPNDRLRAVAYRFHEHNPDRRLGTRLLAAQDKETGEFVRPSLVRALAALSSVTDDDRIHETLIREAGRERDFFRGVVIEALGDYKAQYAFDALGGFVKIDGPLQGDTAVALGKLGDKRALDALTELQLTAPKSSQPYIAAAVCLFGANCESQQKFPAETLRSADRNLGYQDSLRATAAALAQLAAAAPSFEHGTADALIDVGTSSGESDAGSCIAGGGHDRSATNTCDVERSGGTAGSQRGNRSAGRRLRRSRGGLRERSDSLRLCVAPIRRRPKALPAVRLMQTLIEKLDF